eukprot:TRINITY_DN1091_c0_g2_i1.p1 TRINITY_DN1091_c0_g2~~TRINITY_DN1091_c0_g2_i1.p1  ORF type:complete len:129 (+),score=4.99 TRINITY_DN1091_c0_g2_i1:88-474(+)
MAPLIVIWLFYLGVLISVATCTLKAEFNLPLFIFALFVLQNDQAYGKHHKVRFLALFIFSILVDIAWIVFWSTIWSKYYPPGYWENKYHDYIRGATIGIMGIKVISLIILAIRDPEARSVLLCQRCCS